MAERQSASGICPNVSAGTRDRERPHDSAAWDIQNGLRDWSNLRGQVCEKRYAQLEVGDRAATDRHGSNDFLTLISDERSCDNSLQSRS